MVPPQCSLTGLGGPSGLDSIRTQSYTCLGAKKTLKAGEGGRGVALGEGVLFPEVPPPTHPLHFDRHTTWTSDMFRQNRSIGGVDQVPKFPCDLLQWVMLKDTLIFGELSATIPPECTVIGRVA